MGDESCYYNETTKKTGFVKKVSQARTNKVTFAPLLVPLTAEVSAFTKRAICGTAA